MGRTPKGYPHTPRCRFPERRQDAGEGRPFLTSTFYGKEKESLAYVIAVMNMILHGIDAPNILHPNAPEEAPLREPQDIIKEMAALDAEAAEILDGIRGML